MVELGSDQVTIGNNLNEFMVKIFALKNPTIYFHNLAFDISFIYDWLLRNGYEYDEERNSESFNAIISSDNKIYETTIIIKKFNKRYKKVTFRDSYKKLPFTVARIAKAYKLPMLKGNIDYKLQRPRNWVITPTERLYIENDVLIIAKALEIQFEQGLTKMTIGSDAMHTFKSMIPKSHFENMFPVLDSEVDDYIRKFYKGGFTYAMPKYRRRIMGKGLSFDVNSLYPSVMYDRWLPIKKPIYFKGKYKHDENYPLFIQSIRVDFKIKPDHIPTVQLKGTWSFINGVEYSTESNGEVILYLTSVDLKLFLDHYDCLSIEYLEGYKFQQAKGMFCDYIDKFMAIKENSTGAIRENAKLLLNNLYGKFATNPDVTGKYVTLKNDVVSYQLLDPKFRDPVYTAMGAFITAYAREKTIRTAQANYDRFMYADTDSIHLWGTETPDIEIHDSKLGYWGFEYMFSKSKYVRSKMYMEKIIIRSENKNFKPIGKYQLMKSYGYEMVVKGAGIPESQRLNATFENYDIGFKYVKLKPKRVKGGNILIEEVSEVKIS